MYRAYLVFHEYDDRRFGAHMRAVYILFQNVSNIHIYLAGENKPDWQVHSFDGCDGASLKLVYDSKSWPFS